MEITTKITSYVTYATNYVTYTEDSLQNHPSCEFFGEMCFGGIGTMSLSIENGKQILGECENTNLSRAYNFTIRSDSHTDSFLFALICYSEDLDNEDNTQALTSTFQQSFNTDVVPSIDSMRKILDILEEISEQCSCYYRNNVVTNNKSEKEFETIEISVDVYFGEK